MDPITEGEGMQPQDPEGGEGGAPQDPQQDPKPQEGGAGEGGAPQDPEPQEGAVNRHQYERDIQRRDKEIRDLKAQLADEKANAALSAAGCIDLELGRAALEKLGGDVARLREAKPYLFREDDKTPRSTGGRPAGRAPEDARAKARRAAGLRD